jgi:UDP-N-acetylglucosamine:LPS N-acetylglucosamine transferase
MSIAIVSAQTGNGHNAVMKALHEGFNRHGYHDVSVHPSYYEDLLVSNRVLSEFYNFLLVASTEVCAKYVEFSNLKSAVISGLEYRETSANLLKLVGTEGLQAIVSTSPLLNRNLIRALKDSGRGQDVRFYVVITDPFKPMAPGFTEKGATRYFCPTPTVRQLLEDSGIDPALTEVTGFPVSAKFTTRNPAHERESLFRELGLSAEKRTILLNGGAAGAPHYLKLLQASVESGTDWQIILLCGHNLALYTLATRYVRDKYRHVVVLPFSERVADLLSLADVVVTKPGASAFFESLHAGVPVIVDGVTGFLYQEKGVVDFLARFNVGWVLNDYVELLHLLQCCDKSLLDRYRRNIESLQLANGADAIVSVALQDLYGYTDLYAESATSSRSGM